MATESPTTIGKTIRKAKDGNLLIGSFAAEMIGESYPLSKAMWDIVFRDLSDKELGEKFLAWIKTTGRVFR